MDNNQFWDNVYKSKTVKRPTYDLWLDKYIDILEKNNGKEIIDLGCGGGGDTLYLIERGYKVIACDYSEEALKILNKFIPEVNTIQMDISKTLPFEEESIGLIIADLSLHYFNNETTKNVVKAQSKNNKSICQLIFHHSASAKCHNRPAMMALCFLA